MTHRVTQKKLSRDTNERKSLLKNLANSLILHEKIITTHSKAKTVRPFVEKLITRSKEDNIINRRFLISKLPTENAIRKLLELVGPTFKDRRGGYTRIIKLTQRAGDNAPMAVLEFVENVSEIAAKKKLASAKSQKKAVPEKKVERGPVKTTRKTKVTGKPPTAKK